VLLVSVLRRIRCQCLPTETMWPAHGFGPDWETRIQHSRVIPAQLDSIGSSGLFFGFIHLSKQTFKIWRGRFGFFPNALLSWSRGSAGGMYFASIFLFNLERRRPNLPRDLFSPHHIVILLTQGGSVYPDVQAWHKNLYEGCAKGFNSYVCTCRFG